MATPARELVGQKKLSNTHFSRWTLRRGHYNVPFGAVILTFLSNFQTAAAKVQWDTLISKSRELSMSGLLGLIETDILFAEPGTTQPEIWRYSQAALGIGSLRILSQICRSPCFEFLHSMHGIKPPEAVEAREFWLRQESWTELSLMGMTQEDTSYHRINQGSGPQAKMLWSWSEIREEKTWWEALALAKRRSTVTSPPAFTISAPQDSYFLSPDRKTSEDSVSKKCSEVQVEVAETGSMDLSQPMTPRTAAAVTAATIPKPSSKGLTTDVYISRKGAEVTAGTTDKWWMDRWQSEVLAVAAIHRLTMSEASHLVTRTYFGRQLSYKRDLLAGFICLLLTATTFVTGILTNWAWISQFFALTALGYFVNCTACLRCWKFEPNAALKDEIPELLYNWPEEDENKSVVRIAVQSAGVCHLRGLVAFDADKVRQAREVAMKMRGRYREMRKLMKEHQPPYSDPLSSHYSWISYDSQSSFYGLVTSVVPDNVKRRSLGILGSMVNGIALLMLGFGSTIARHWSGIVLAIYVVGILLALFGRRRGAKWTLPEFQVVDLTSMNVPPTVRDRIWQMKGAEKVKSGMEKSQGRQSTKRSDFTYSSDV